MTDGRHSSSVFRSNEHTVYQRKPSITMNTRALPLAVIEPSPSPYLTRAYHPQPLKFNPKSQIPKRYPAQARDTHTTRLDAKSDTALPIT